MQPDIEIRYSLRPVLFRKVKMTCVDFCVLVGLPATSRGGKDRVAGEPIATGGRRSRASCRSTFARAVLAPLRSAPLSPSTMRPTAPSWLKLLVPVKRTVDCTSGLHRRLVPFGP
jgi:hypothetical protein